MTPPPAEELVPRLFRGPALRTQPDRRLVALVRQGYETAFEEIVRRYGKPLGHYAAAIVGARGEDVTQDAFSKALLALRRDGAEIELRPWLFRIVRNTALNDLRDRPPSPEVLAEAIAGGRNPAEEAERREELADLIRRLQSLPEPQRAAIVMRELEGLSHEEIAAALGLSGGAARQAIYRARQALRDGLGMLLPLPLLKALLAGTAAAPIEATAGAAGAGVALKAATATVLVAGAVGAGVAVHDNRQGEGRSDAKTQRVAAGDSRPATASTPTGNPGHGPASGAADARGSGHRGEPNSGDDRFGPGPGGDDRGGHGRGPGGDHDGSDPEPGTDHGDRSESAGHQEPDDDSHRSGSSEEDSSGPGANGSGEDGGLDDHSGSGDDSPSSGGDDSASSEGSGSNSGPGSGGEISESGSESEESGDSHGGDGFSVQMVQPTEEGL